MLSDYQLMKSEVAASFSGEVPKLSIHWLCKLQMIFMIVSTGTITCDHESTPMW